MKALYRLALTLTIATVAVGLTAVRPCPAHAQMSVISGTWQSNYGPTAFFVPSPVRESNGAVAIRGAVFYVDEDGEETGEHAEIQGWLQYDPSEGYRIVFYYWNTYGDDGYGNLVLLSDYTLTGSFQSRQDSSISGEWQLWGYAPAEHPGHPHLRR